ncbi:hypothetical protein Btru_046020 [Bulinus truncatus]|nr:hypothetical protein Btru_046020 [Bulinus truncatus]
MAQTNVWVTFDEDSDNFSSPGPPASSSGQLPALPSTPLVSADLHDGTASPRALNSADHHPLSHCSESPPQFNKSYVDGVSQESYGDGVSQKTFPDAYQEDMHSQFQQVDKSRVAPGVSYVSSEVQTDSQPYDRRPTALNGGNGARNASEFWGNSLPLTTLQSCRAAESWQGGSMPLQDSQDTIFQPEEKIKDHTALSVIVCFFFFLPIGLVALLFALDAKSYKQQGRLRQAREKSKLAFQINMLGIFMGCIIYTLSILLYLW